MEDLVIAIVVMCVLVSAIRGVLRGSLRYFSIIFLSLFAVGHLSVLVGTPSSVLYAFGANVLIFAMAFGNALLLYRWVYRLYQLRTSFPS